MTSGLGPQRADSVDLVAERRVLGFVAVVEGNFLDRSLANPVIGSGERLRCPPC